MVTRHVTRHSGSSRAGPERATSGTAGATWVRVPAAGGVLFFALVLVFGVLSSNVPAVSDPQDEVFRTLADRQDRLQLAAAAYGLAMPPVLLFLAGLYAALRKAEGQARFAVAALAGGVVAAAASVTGAMVLGTLATRVEDLGPALARVFWTMFLLSFGATLLGHALMLAATATVAARAPLLPRWLVVATIVLVAGSLVGALGVGYVSVGVQVTAGITVVLNSVWILLVSLHLWRHPDLADR